jgi:hypothetical protein
MFPNGVIGFLMHLLSIYNLIPITVAACASCLLVPSVLLRMSERKVNNNA